jgi:hypothetical protein
MHLKKFSGGNGRRLTWYRVHGSYTSEEITGKSVTTSRRGGILAISCYHIVDCGHVNGILLKYQYKTRKSSTLELTFAIPIMAAKIRGTIHGIPASGPKLVQAKPNNPMVSRGATVKNISFVHSKVIFATELTKKQPVQA